MSTDASQVKSSNIWESDKVTFNLCAISITVTRPKTDDYLAKWLIEHIKTLKWVRIFTQF